MAARYQLTRREGDSEPVELKNTMYRDYQPEHHTGIMVQRKGGWQWTHEGREYRTDRSGDGLWINTSQGWSQCQGTSQFSLSHDRQAALRQLRREGLEPDAVSAH